MVFCREFTKCVQLKRYACFSDAQAERVMAIDTPRRRKPIANGPSRVVSYSEIWLVAAAGGIGCPSPGLNIGHSH
jgi:hypothetical protein